MLKPDTIAPPFSAVETTGKTIDLAELRQRGPVVLQFTRYIGCPLAQRRFVELQAALPGFEKRGASLVVVTESGEDHTRRFLGKRGLAFPVICDTDKRLFALYDANTGSFRQFIAPPVLAATVRSLLAGFMQGKHDGATFQLPADFIVAADGSLLFAHYGENIADHAPISKLLNLLD